WVELQAIAENLGVEHVQRKQVQSQDGYDEKKDIARRELADADDPGGEQGQPYAQVGNQADETADRPDKVTKVEPQSRKDRRADHRHENTHQEVSNHETAHHLGDQSQGNVSGVPVFH